MSESMNVLQRLHLAMGKVDYIQKEKKQGMQYNIVSHDAVTAKVRPVLVECGVIYYPVASKRSQDGNRTEMDLTVRFCNIDDKDDYIDVVATGYGVDSQDKGPGKAISYAVKYALLKALGLETGDDPDEVQDERANHKPTPDARPEQVRIYNEIGACMDAVELASCMDKNKLAIQSLPVEFQDSVDTAYNSKEAEIKAGNPEKWAQMFLGVEDSRKRAATLKDEMERQSTLIGLSNWITLNKPTIDNLKGQSQGMADKDRFMGYVEAKRKALQEASKNTMQAG